MASGEASRGAMGTLKTPRLPVIWTGSWVARRLPGGIVGLKRIAFRGSNNLLKGVGLRLSVIAQDFDARLDQPAQLHRVFSTFGKIADEWLRRQEIFPVKNRFETAELLGEFYEEFLER
ncbi:MAG: hypothetical protein WA476_18850, partial [Acidobacteriaceae bacterium]